MKPVRGKRIISGVGGEKRSGKKGDGGEVRRSNMATRRYKWTVRTYARRGNRVLSSWGGNGKRKPARRPQCDNTKCGAIRGDPECAYGTVKKKGRFEKKKQSTPSPKLAGVSATKQLFKACSLTEGGGEKKCYLAGPGKGVRTKLD